MILNDIFQVFLNKKHTVFTLNIWKLHFLV